MANMFEAKDFVGLYVTLGAAFVAMVLRLIARQITRCRLWYDDYLSVLAFVSAAGMAVNILLLVFASPVFQDPDPSAGPPTEEQTLQIIRRTYIALFVSGILNTFSLGAATFSILAFYWRLFNLSTLKVPIQILVGLTTVWFFSRLLTIIFSCSPVHAYWDKTIENSHCWDQEIKFLFYSLLAHLILDLLILCLPMIGLRHLRLPLGQKIGVMALFAFGFLVCLTTVNLLYLNFHFDADKGIDAAELSWPSIEQNLAVLSTSLPLMRPIFIRFIPGSWLNSAHSKSNSRKALKLRTITTPDRMFVEKEEDGTSSASKSTVLETVDSNVADLEAQIYKGSNATRTVTCSQYDNANPSTDEDKDGVVYARNETVVHVEPT